MVRRPIGEIPQDNLRRAGVGSRGIGRRCGEGSTDKGISKESLISNIKDESDRSKDDPDRSEGIQAMTKAKGRS